MPGGFYLQADFSRVNAPGDKVHLESSHRSFHHFEMRVIKAFDRKIVKIALENIFINNKKEKIMVTYLDINLDQLRKSGLFEAYRKEHNEHKHHFSVDGVISTWAPAEKFARALENQTDLLSFCPDDLKNFMKYGFDKVKATVSNRLTLTFKNRTYYVAVGKENFSRQKSTKVYISQCRDKLFIFEFKPDGILLAEALCREPFTEKPKPQPSIQANAVELIADFLESRHMIVDRAVLIETHHQGLTFEMAKKVYTQNHDRYEHFRIKLRQPEKITGKAIFNAFILDCQRQLSSHDFAGYARNFQI